MEQVKRNYKVNVHFFGFLAERAGRSGMEVAVEEPTVRAVVAAAVEAVPGLKLDRSILFAVNTDLAEPMTPVRQDDVVSLLPPVGGG